MISKFIRKKLKLEHKQDSLDELEKDFYSLDDYNVIELMVKFRLGKFIYQLIIVLGFIGLAIAFHKWWIVFFSILFI